MAILKETIINGNAVVKGNLILQDPAGNTLYSDVAAALSMFYSNINDLCTYWRAQCPNNNGWVMRVGPIVRYSYHAIWTPPAGIHKNFTTIPVGFRPTDSVRQSFNTVASDKINNYITVGVNGDGRVNVWSYGNNTTEYYFDMIWITRDSVPDDSFKIQ